MSEIFYKRNLAVPFFTQRDNTYIWQQIDIDSMIVVRTERGRR